LLLFCFLFLLLFVKELKYYLNYYKRKYMFSFLLWPLTKDIVQYFSLKGLPWCTGTLKDDIIDMTDASAMYLMMVDDVILLSTSFYILPV